MWICGVFFCQKRVPKRRLKSRGNGAMGVASERAVSIPQITYDHIDDKEEKKDVTFFQDGKRGSVEGNLITALCSEHADIITAVISTCYVPDWSSTNVIAYLLSERKPASATHEKSQPCFQFS